MKNFALALLRSALHMDA